MFLKIFSRHLEVAVYSMGSIPKQILQSKNRVFILNICILPTEEMDNYRYIKQLLLFVDTCFDLTSKSRANFIICSKWQIYETIIYILVPLMNWMVI